MDDLDKKIILRYKALATSLSFTESSVIFRNMIYHQTNVKTSSPIFGKSKILNRFVFLLKKNMI